MRELVLGLLMAVVLGSPARADEPAKVVTLGDSITRGVRPGVKADETFTAYLGAALKEKGVKAEVINAGVGGEVTTQALKRLERDVLARKPRLVAVMYGTNDSYVDRGKKDSRLTPEEFRRNLTQLVQTLRKGGVVPLLMTAPRWAKDAGPDGSGESPNVRLERFMVLCREVARAEKVPLVDHFAHWTEAENKGVNLREWTTDGYHPNPRGHREMANLMLPAVLEALKNPAKP
jgi:lysophospholipase L1-like esterase